MTETLVPAPLVMVDALGRDISGYFIQQHYVCFDERGTVTAAGHMGLWHVQEKIAAGDRYLFGEAELDPQNNNQASKYVKDWPSNPVLLDRPFLPEIFPMDGVAAGTEITIAALPACEVTFSGPVKGRHQHEGGDLEIGFTIPGDYRIKFTAHPYMPVDQIMKVV